MKARSFKGFGPSRGITFNIMEPFKADWPGWNRPRPDRW